MSGPARLLERLLCAAVLGAWSASASAVTVCSVSPASISLGTYYGDTSAPADSVGTVVVRCARTGGPQNVSVTLGLGPSATSGTVASRALLQVGGSDRLNYNLFRDPLRQNVWGQSIGIDTLTTLVAIPNNTSVNVTFNLYGRMPGLQNVYAGSYGDSLLMTISY